VIDQTIEHRPFEEIRGRPLTWKEAVSGYLPQRYRAWGLEHAHLLPLAFMTMMFSLMALRLNNTAFIDEALYINAGHDYLNHWFSSGPYVDHAGYFSGHPKFYPVIAAALDSMGGLWLVRAFSWMLMLATILMVTSVSQRFFGYRAGMFTAIAMAFVGPVIFVGHLATFDALCITFITAAAWLATTRTSLPSAAAVGLLLMLASVTKYAGGVFVPVVLALTFLVGARPFARTALATAMVGVTGLGGFFFASDSLRGGIGFTTTARTALGPSTSVALISILLISLGLLIALALFGGLLVARSRSWRATAAVLVLLGASALIPAGQFILSEMLAFEKHLAYSAVFLSPLAGLALDRLSRGVYLFTPAALILVLMLGVGDVRSRGLIQWGDVSPVLEVIEHNPDPGLYLSSHADTLKYHTRNHDDITWQTTFSLYPQGEEAIRAAVAAGRYDTIVLHGGDSTGNPDQDRGELILVSAIAGTPEYSLTRTEGGWRIFTLSEPIDPEEEMTGPGTDGPVAQASTTFVGGGR
jgi:hypothetical protein